MFCHLEVGQGAWTGKLKKAPSSRSYRFSFSPLHSSDTPPDRPLTGHAKHEEEHTMDLSANSIRRPRKVLTATHQQKQPPLLIGSPSASVLTRMISPGLATENAPLSRAPGPSSHTVSETPGRFQPEQSLQIGLVLAKQHAVPAVRVTAVGSEFCLRNTAVQEKYLHNREWAAPDGSVPPALRPSLALSDGPGVSVAFAPHLRSAWRHNLEPNN